MARRASAIVLLLLLIACRPTRTPEPNKDSHYPLQLGQQWTYDTRVYGGQGGRSATSVTAVCRIQIDEDGDLLHLVSTCSEDQLVQAQLVYQLGAEIVEPVLFNAEGEPRTRDPPVTIARLHMLVGDQWRWSGTSGDDDERMDLYRVANRALVRTEAGEFDSVRLLVTQEGPNAAPAVVERWYAPGVGLVKEVGVALFPGTDGQPAQIELVRTLKERSVRPVDQIPCCSKVPSSAP
jgi:hypothetical protein